MENGLAPHESVALYELLAEQSPDAVLKCGSDGRVLFGSRALHLWGMAWAEGRPLLELVDPAGRAGVQAAFDAALRGEPGEAAEFCALGVDGPQRWFEIRFRPLKNADAAIYGAVALMRSIQERRVYEEKLFHAEMTDALTGLTNRPAFVSMLQHLIDGRSGGCVAIFALDYFKALNMRYGQSFGDEVLVTFAELLRNLMRSEDIISRLGSETLGVLLPGARADQAEVICQRVIAAMAEIRQAAGPDSVAITASVGLSRIGKSVDGTIKRAEMALFLAKAKGRNRLERESDNRMANARNKQHP